MYATERPTDSPELHQGRKRAAPHVRGQWASHVYLERMCRHFESRLVPELTPDATQTVSPSSSLRKVLQQSYDAVVESASSSEDAAAAVHSLLPGARTDHRDTTDEALHLSLSRPLMLLTNQRQDLKKAVARIADRFRPCVLPDRPDSWLHRYITFPLTPSAGHQLRSSICLVWHPRE